MVIETALYSGQPMSEIWKLNTRRLLKVRKKTFEKYNDERKMAYQLAGGK